MSEKTPNLNKYILAYDGVLQSQPAPLPPNWNGIEDFNYIHDNELLRSYHFYPYEKIDTEGNLVLESNNRDSYYYDYNEHFDFEKGEPIVQPKKVIGREIKIFEDKVQEICTTEDKTPEEIANEKQITLSMVWGGVRGQRNVKIEESDYLLLSDIFSRFTETEQQQILEYRQKLRDITKTTNSPRKIIWPEKPKFLEKA